MVIRSTAFVIVGDEGSGGTVRELYTPINATVVTTQVVALTLETVQVVSVVVQQDAVQAVVVVLDTVSGDVAVESISGDVQC